MTEDEGAAILQLLRMIESTNAATGRQAEAVIKLAENTTESFSRLAEAAQRFRAWESLLCLHFAGHYARKPDPAAAAASDRERLAALHRGAQDEEGARQIGEVFAGIFAMLDAAGEAREGKRKRGGHLALVRAEPAAKASGA